MSASPAYARAVEAANMWYSTPDGIADAVLDAALDIEEMAAAMCPHSHCDGSKGSCPDYTVNMERAKGVYDSIVWDGS